jgi:hypothetical protein
MYEANTCTLCARHCVRAYNNTLLLEPQQVKSDQDRSKDLDRRIADVTADTERMQRQLVELEADLKQDRRGDIDPAKVRIYTHALHMVDSLRNLQLSHTHNVRWALCIRTSNA